MVSPVWSSHTATVGHTCALAKQGRQTVRIETIAGQLSTRGRAVAHGVRLGQAENRQRDRTEGAKATCKGRGDVEGSQVARHRDWHGAAHRKGV